MDQIQTMPPPGVEYYAVAYTKNVPDYNHSCYVNVSLPELMTSNPEGKNKIIYNKLNTKRYHHAKYSMLAFFYIPNYPHGKGGNL